MKEMLEKYALVSIMKEVLVNAANRYSVNETARKTKISVFAAKQALDYMYSKGMITLDKVGNTFQYQANKESPLTRQWKILFSLEELDKAKIIQNILDTKKSILSILLYGSCATGKDDQNSDMDLIVVGDLDIKGKREISVLARGTTREINISVYSIMEWKKKKEQDKIFYEHVIIDSVSLYGEKPVV
ncbi:MAG: nucleotidyltransferase domain-containing protein [Candidatus Micrarchaeota archaeon]